MPASAAGRTAKGCLAAAAKASPLGSAAGRTAAAMASDAGLKAVRPMGSRGTSATVTATVRASEIDLEGSA